MDSLKHGIMATIWIIAFVLGLIAVCVSLWVTFVVVVFVVQLFRVAHRDLAYRRAEKHHPGIHARLQRTLALREAERKRKEARKKWLDERWASITRKEREARAHRAAAAWAYWASL